MHYTWKWNTTSPMEVVVQNYYAENAIETLM